MNTMNTMLKNLNIAILAIIATCAVSNINAYNHVLKPSETVKNSGGNIHYGMAAVAGGLDFQDIALNTNDQIGWNSAGMCIHGYDISIRGGKFDGESFKFERGFPCQDTYFFLGTPDEIQQKLTQLEQRFRNQGNPSETIEKLKKIWYNEGIYKGSQGKLQMLKFDTDAI